MSKLLDLISKGTYFTANGKLIEIYMTDIVMVQNYYH